MDASTSLVIETHNLSKAYKGVQVLKDLRLTVRQHSICGFLGPNGAGKTTTMKLLLGLIRPTGGSGTVFGQDIVGDSVAIRGRVGFLPQQPRFADDMTARETLRFTARFFFSGPRPKIEAKVDEMLDLVGLQDKADRPLKGFSGGERQSGVTESILSKPVSREAYILSKLAADAIGVVVILVAAQSAIGYGLLALANGAPLPLAPFLVGAGGLALHTLFYLSLTLLMGVLASSRGMLLGVPLGVLFGGALAVNFLGKAALFTPWSLTSVLPATVLQLPVPAALPLGITAALTVIAIAVTLWKFRQMEI